MKSNQIYRDLTASILLPVLVRGLNFLSLPFLYAVLDSKEYVKFGVYLALSGILSALLDFGFKQRILNQDMRKQEVLSFWVSTTLLVAIFSLVFFAFHIFFEDSRLGHLGVFLAFALYDGMLNVTIGSFLMPLLSKRDKATLYITQAVIYVTIIQILIRFMIPSFVSKSSTILVIYLLIGKSIVISLFVFRRFRHANLRLALINPSFFKNIEFGLFDRFTVGSLLNVTIVFTCSLDRLLAGKILRAEDAAFYFLAFQTFSILGAVLEQWIFIKRESFLSNKKKENAIVNMISVLLFIFCSTAALFFLLVVNTNPNLPVLTIAGMNMIYMYLWYVYQRTFFRFSKLESHGLIVPLSHLLGILASVALAVSVLRAENPSLMEMQIIPISGLFILILVQSFYFKSQIVNKLEISLDSAVILTIGLSIALTKFLTII